MRKELVPLAIPRGLHHPVRNPPELSRPTSVVSHDERIGVAIYGIAHLDTHPELLTAVVRIGPLQEGKKVVHEDGRWAAIGSQAVENNRGFGEGAHEPMDACHDNVGLGTVTNLTLIVNGCARQEQRGATDRGTAKEHLRQRL